MLHFVFKIWASLALAFLPTLAVAQGIVGLSPQAPPTYSMRQFGIDLSTSDVQLVNDDISVGSGEFPAKLTLSRTYSAIGYPFRSLPTIAAHNHYTGFGQGSTHNLLAYFTRQRCSTANNSRIIKLTAVVLGQSYHFSGGGCIQTGPSILVSNGDDGATMRIVDPNQLVWTYELITREGVRVLFSDAAGYRYDTIGGRYATVAEFANGDFVGFTYSSSPTVSGTVRPATVYNSRGYGLSFSYKSRARYFGPNTLTDSSLITSVTSYKKTASATTNLATVAYVYDTTDYVVSSFQNSGGGVVRYTYNEGRPTAVFLPKNLTQIPSTAISYFDGLSQISSGQTSANAAGVFYLLGSGDNVRDVAWSVPNSVKDAAGNVTLFQFSDPTAPDPMSVTITNPDGSSKGYTTIFCPTSPACPLAPNYMRMPTHYSDENSRLWLYKYDLHGRPLNTTNPEGAVKSVTRDARGNIAEIRNKPVSGSGAPDISSSAGYVACTSVNYKYCNQPAYTIDPRGGRWDFQYDPSSGSLAVSLAPADANGLRAVTRYTYAAFPFGPVALPAQRSSSSIFLLSIKDACLTSAVSSGTVDFSYICPQANRVRETYAYAPASLELVGVKPDADNNTASTSYTYDVVGNVTSSKDLMGNISFTTYDPLRRKVFEIGADPDGTGPLTRPMVRHIYDSNGNEIRTETGVGSQTNGADFAITQFVRRTFDLNDQLVRVEDVTP
jgi:YD repeat-containing protein